MKFYISASNQVVAIKLANAISKSGSQPIISEMESDIPESIISDITDNAESGSLSIVVCSNPIKLVLAANKTGYFDAVACGKAEDFSLAMNEGANLIAIQDDNDLINEVASIMGSSTGSNFKQPTIQQSNKSSRAAVKFQKPEKPKFSFAKKEQPKQKVPLQEEDKKPAWDGNKGIKKNLKDIFGIE